MLTRFARTFSGNDKAVHAECEQSVSIPFRCIPRQVYKICATLHSICLMQMRFATRHNHKASSLSMSGTGRAITIRGHSYKSTRQRNIACHCSNRSALHTKAWNSKLRSSGNSGVLCFQHRFGAAEGTGFGLQLKSKSLGDWGETVANCCAQTVQMLC